MFSVFLNGLSTGLLLQLAIGPVFFFILNISLQRTLVDGFFSVIAVTIVDYLYILLAIAGVGKLLEKESTKRKLGIVSSAALCVFGLITLHSAGNSLNETAISVEKISNYSSSFITTFLLTVSSPLTMIFWTGLFTTKAIENNYGKKQIVIFGISAGFATLLFLGTAVTTLSLVKTSIPLSLVTPHNMAVGSLLIIYGFLRFFKIIRNRP